MTDGACLYLIIFSFGCTFFCCLPSLSLLPHTDPHTSFIYIWKSLRFSFFVCLCFQLSLKERLFFFLPSLRLIFFSLYFCLYFIVGRDELLFVFFFFVNLQLRCWLALFFFSQIFFLPKFVFILPPFFTFPSFFFAFCRARSYATGKLLPRETCAGEMRHLYVQLLLP